MYHPKESIVESVLQRKHDFNTIALFTVITLSDMFLRYKCPPTVRFYVAPLRGLNLLTSSTWWVSSNHKRISYSIRNPYPATPLYVQQIIVVSIGIRPVRQLNRDMKRRVWNASFGVLACFLTASRECPGKHNTESVPCTTAIVKGLTCNPLISVRMLAWINHSVILHTYANMY